MRLSDFIRRRRKELNMTQKQLAKEVGQNPGWICMLESGLRMPGAVTMPILSAALEVPEAMLSIMSGHSPVTDFKDDLTIEQLEAAVKEFVAKVGADI
jgi:transcriptional regulator with XRE-family HTH domain